MKLFSISLILFGISNIGFASSVNFNLECKVFRSFQGEDGKKVFCKGQPVRFNSEDENVDMGCGFKVTSVDLLPYGEEPKKWFALDVDGPEGSLIPNSSFLLQRESFSLSAGQLVNSALEYETGIDCTKN